MLGLLLLLLMPVFFIAAGVSIPLTHLRRYLERRREARFTLEMKAIGRWISWEEAIHQAADRGTLVGEYLSIKGPYRLWWTSADVANVSPHRCCLEVMPWEFEDDGFFDWCSRRFTDPVSGTAAIVDRSNVKPKQLMETLAEIRTRNGCVSIGTRSFKEKIDAREAKN